jgi:hypothetical protein
MAGGTRAKRTAKRETYYDRWRRQHVRVSFYFDRNEYEKLKELASSKNMTVKEFVLSLMEGFDKYYDEVYEKAMNDESQFLMNLFIDDPHGFYDYVKYDVEEKGIELAFFTLPCSICGKPMLFTHKDKNWSSEVRPTLLDAFRRWGHVCCFEVRDGKRASCTHMPHGFRLPLSL